MKNYKLNIAVFLALLLAISGCQKDEIVTEPISETEESQFQDGMLQLGEKLENPYTVENMRKAYNNINGSSQLKSASITESDIDITHLYVRFLPKSDEELGILQIDTTLELFDYPLDYEIQEGGTYYHDSELPDTAITWQYCAVKNDFIFPNIEYEVLDELFLPETMEEDSSSLKSADEWSFWDELEVEALKITDNYEGDESNGLKATNWGRKKWKPSGTIRVNDNSGLGWIPVVGCKARAYSWFTIKSDLTDNNGYFYINHNFKGHVNYSIKWERADFDIRSGNWGQAYYNGPRYKEKAWNLDIGKGGISWVYAHVHRGAYTYWYNNTYGIKTPPKNSFWKRKVKIGVMDKGGRAFYKKSNRWNTFPEIKIYKKTASGTERSSKLIYGTIVHELAHSSHWDIDKSTFRNADDIVIESWAVGVAYVFVDDVYGSDNFSWNSYTFNDINTDLEGIYTPLVIDLIDNTNQRATHWNSTNYPIDQVTGFNLGQIENALKKKKTLTEWRNNLESLYNISTDANIDELFDNYINL
ncbi:MAG: hypothetical protein JEZ09_13910 [Salinivirgaceae bacterium]|nr:hypothetical protein [Salinivirgaceae bacterium]